MQTNSLIVEQILTLIDQGVREDVLVKRFPDEPVLVRDLIMLTSDLQQERKRLTPSEDQLRHLLSSLSSETVQVAALSGTNIARAHSWFSLPRLMPAGFAVLLAVVVGVLALQRKENAPLPVVVVNTAEKNAEAPLANGEDTETPQPITNSAPTDGNRASEPSTNTPDVDDTAVLLASLSELDAESTALASDVASLDRDAQDADAVLSSASLEDIGTSLDAISSS